MSDFVLTPRDFDAWLRGYQSAWEQRDAQAAAELFTPDAEYYWTPFDTPQRGRAEIAAVWDKAVSGQRDVSFRYDVLAVNGAAGIAHWHTNLTAVPDNVPVELDGVLVATFTTTRLCRVFREWWHTPAAKSEG
jgi:ketosteroid isomerase-like protein